MQNLKNHASSAKIDQHLTSPSKHHVAKKPTSSLNQQRVDPIGMKQHKIKILVTIKKNIIPQPQKKMLD